MNPNVWHLISLAGARFPASHQVQGRGRYDRRKAVTWYTNAGFSRATAESLVAKHAREARMGS